MNKICIKGFLCVLVACLSVLLSIHVGESAPYSLTNQELDALLAPIALYPDPLLAQILPAATYPEDIADAAAWLRSGGNPLGIDEQNWDQSVKAIAHYPNILNMMAGNMDWTADLGDAFLNQPEGVAMSIQRLRWQARNVGNLVSNNDESVIVDGDYIEIIPAQPQYIYVPQYDPSVIYEQGWTSGAAPFITFGLGLAIGDWLSMDFDWHHHHLFYHGWNRPGWVNNARPYVHIRNVYINRSRPAIQQTWRHDAAHGSPEQYRASRPGGANIGRYARRTPDVRGRDTTPPKPLEGTFGPKGNTQSFSNRGRESLGAARLRPTTPSTQRPAMPAPEVTRRPTVPAAGAARRPTTPPPGISGGFSQPGPARENVRPASNPSSAFGGYRGANEARTQSNRGQASRQSSVAAHPPTAPVNRGSAPAGNQAPGGSKRR